MPKNISFEKKIVCSRQKDKRVGDLKFITQVVKSECTLNRYVKDDLSLCLLRYIMMNPYYVHDSTLNDLDD